MAKKYQWAITLPDGTVALRNTDRVYTHGVAVIDSEEYSRKSGRPRTWGILGWAGRPDLVPAVEKRARKLMPNYFSDVKVLPVFLKRQRF